MKIQVIFWVITPCSDSGGPYCCFLQGEGGGSMALQNFGIYHITI